MLRLTEVENGRIRGVAGSDPRVTVFKGVPYAAPPVGKNRWKAPNPCNDWNGIYEANSFAPIPYQDTPGLGTDIYCREWHVDPEIPMSEDCLYLNIWTPAKSKDEKLPVLVWYYGGSFQWGYTAEMELDGEALAKRGIVVVSVAYRLGCFGNLAHKELTKEAQGAPGNFSLLDQKAGLHWVHRNIAAFGGDPDNIKIAGQSAGGASVMNQLVCEDNKDIIKGAVIFSGIISLDKTDDQLFVPKTLSSAEELGEKFIESLGACGIEEARSLSSKKILEGYNKYLLNNPMMVPIIDGVFCKEKPLDAFVNGKYPDVPILAGNTVDEFIEDNINMVEKSVKEALKGAKKSKPDGDFFYYRFCPDIPGDGAGDEAYPGCFHSVDLWFFFETLGKSHRAYEGRHYDLAAQMSDYFANFVKTGNPNGTGKGGKELPVWDTYTSENPNEMEFTSRGAVPKKEGGIRQNTRRQGINPYLPNWEYIPDGEPYVFGDRVYVYGSHDIYGGETFCLGDYVCWSAPVDDLGNWKYEGVIFKKTQDPLNPDGHMCLYAPDVTVGPDGRYYLYYVLDKVSVVSVAVSDRPAGPYEFYGYVHYEDGVKLGDKEGDEPQFDPGVMTEGDEVYMYTGFCGQGDKSRSGAMFTVLDKDMLTVKKAPKIIAPGSEYSKGTSFEGHAFFEASSIRKRGDIYYFVYSSEVMHELCYASSKSPEGPFEYGGVIVSNCDMHIDTYKKADEPTAYGANNHGSIVEIGDDWYIFYHRHTNGTWFSRQGCAEKISFAQDRSIPQVEITSCGLNGGPLSDKGEYPAYIACNIFTKEHKMYVEPGAPRVVQVGGDESYGESYIKDIVDGTTIGFKYFDFEKLTGLRIKTRAYFNGDFEILTDLDGEPLGKIHAIGSNIWTADECRFDAVSGVNALYLRYKGTGNSSLLSIEFLHD